MDHPTRHILLRDRRFWLGTTAGLAIDRDGLLTLARVPAPAGGKAITVTANYPYARVVSGLALGPCDAVFVADTEHHRVLYRDGLCKTDAWISVSGTPGSMPGQFNTPRGLAFTPDALLVADSGNARIQHFALPALEANREWDAWAQPTSIAVDGQGRVLAIDTATKRLHRVDANGFPDFAFDAAIVASAALGSPLFVASGREDRVLVSDATTDQVFVFDAQGALLLALATPPGCLPGAIAAHGARIYVADASSGAILFFSDDGAFQGVVAGYTGPATALAVGADGDLYVKPALDAAYYVLESDLAFVGAGTLEAGPFDAGELLDWERARIDADLPAGTHCTLEAAQLHQAVPGPLAADWHAMPSQDALLLSLLPADPLAPPAEPEDRRYLWLRLTLSTTNAKASPAVAQVHAATPAENYLDHLPFTYRYNDHPAKGVGGLLGAEGFLSRMLKLVRGEWSGIAQAIDDMPHVADAQFVDASELSWLAQWLALELPQIASDAERRELIARAAALFARRGTPGSIAEFVALHTGVRPAILESFEDRHIWLLGHSSRLDFDTQLPALDPLGMVVPELDAKNAACPDGIAATTSTCEPGPIGRVVVGESGPLATYQLGLPLFSEDAYKFCVFVDAYRAQDPGTLAEIRRIVDREKPAHTDYRIELVEPDMRVGMQARVGIDSIVGGDPPMWRVAAQLGIGTTLAPIDGASRVGEATLGESLTLT